ncbi:ATP-binding protein [Planctomycetota bacterium]
MTIQVLFTWSSGKDGAMALWELQQSEDYEIAALLSTITRDYRRISMHGVRCELLERQAVAVGIPMVEVGIDRGASQDEYQGSIERVLRCYKEDGVTHVAYGDIFLEDLRKFREEKLATLDLEALFPIWKRDTQELADGFIKDGFKAILTCVDTAQLDGSFSGREYDQELLDDLPDSVDPCGENGEFHTFCYAGPIFKWPVRFTVGESTLRNEQFMFTDLIPEE